MPRPASSDTGGRKDPDSGTGQTESELLELLRRYGLTAKDDLPKTPQAVGSALSRAAPSLRLRAWQVRPAKSGSKRRWVLFNPRVKGNYGHLAVPGAPGAPTPDDSWDGSDGGDGPGPLVPFYESEDATAPAPDISGPADDLRDEGEVP
jgi:hypothetical protein